MKKLFTVESLVRLGTVLLLLLCGLVLLKLRPLWHPVLDVFLTLFVPFMIAVFITYLLHPVVEALHSRGIPRSLAVLIIYLAFFAGIGIVIVKSIPYLITQLEDLVEQLPVLSQTYQHWIGEFYEHTDQLPETVHTEFENMLAAVENYINSLITNIIDAMKSFWNHLFTWIVIPFLVFYMLKDIELIYKLAWTITPIKWREPGKRLVKDIDRSLGSYIRGQLTVALVLSFLAVIAFWLTGIPYPIILGIIIGVTDFIPYFGPILGAIPVTLLAATLSVNKLLIVVGILIILQFVEGNILGPLIVGRNLHIHPIGIIFALLIGGEVGGIVGLIVAVPVFAIGKVLFLHARNHFRSV